MLPAMRGLTIAAVVAVTRIAAADPPPPTAPSSPPVVAPADATEAGAAFQRGRELARLGRYAEACVEFSRSYDLDPALGTAVNLADCLERQGELRRAWLLFDLVARGSQNVQSRARLARERADALAARLATIVVTVRDPAAPGLAIRIGDRSVAPAAEIRDIVEPRDVEVVATVPGRAAFRATLHAAAGATLALDIPAFAAPRETPTVTRRRRPYLYAAGGLAAAGAAALGTSAVLGLAARGAYRDALAHDCLPEQIAADAGYAICRARVERAGVRADHATWIAAGGAALVVAAAAVVFAAPRETVQLAPVATDRALGLGVIGRF